MTPYLITQIKLDKTIATKTTMPIDIPAISPCVNPGNKIKS